MIKELNNWPSNWPPTYWPIDWQTNQLADRPIDRQTDLLADGLTDWQTERLADRLACRQTCLLTGQLVDRPVGRSAVGRRTDRQIHWLIKNQLRISFISKSFWGQQYRAKMTKKMITSDKHVIIRQGRNQYFHFARTKFPLFSLIFPFSI